MAQILKKIIIHCVFSLVIICAIFGNSFVVRADGACISSNQNYCLLAPLPGVGDSSGAVDTKMGVGSYVNALIKIAIGLMSVLAVVMIVMGGIQYMTTTSGGEKNAGKERITNALFGLLLALSSYLLLRTINPKLVDLQVGIPATTLVNLSDAEPGQDGLNAGQKAPDGHVGNKVRDTAGDEIVANGGDTTGLVSINVNSDLEHNIVHDSFVFAWIRRPCAQIGLVVTHVGAGDCDSKVLMLDAYPVDSGGAVMHILTGATVLGEDSPANVLAYSSAHTEFQINSNLKDSVKRIFTTYYHQKDYEHSHSPGSVFDNAKIDKIVGFSRFMYDGPNMLQSAHAFGLALDISMYNSSEPPPQLVADFKAEGWGWGGDFVGTAKDPTHFSKLQEEGGRGSNSYGRE